MGCTASRMDGHGRHELSGVQRFPARGRRDASRSRRLYRAGGIERYTPFGSRQRGTAPCGADNDNGSHFARSRGDSLCARRSAGPDGTLSRRDLYNARRAHVGSSAAASGIQFCTIAEPVSHHARRPRSPRREKALMWIVHLALRRPYTFVCVAILMLAFGVMSIRTMAVDIFPTINIPAVSVIWNYGGLSPRDIEQRIVSTSERGYSATVNGIEHIESESLNGTALIKVYFQPTAAIAAGVAQIAAVSQQVIRSMPPGITPPLIVRFNATDVSILSLGISSPQRTEAQLNDLATNFIRNPLATIEGLTIPPANGGANRVINIDIDPALLYAQGLSPTDVTTALR